MKRLLIASVLVVAGLATTTPAIAKDVVVQMKNAGPGGSMVFVPMMIQAEPGDTIRFLPTDPGHNAQTIDGMVPDGTPKAVGQIGKELDFKVSKPGVYGIECKPHFGLGMIALVKVGRGPSPNLAAAKVVKLPPLAAKRMTPMLAKVN